MVSEYVQGWKTGQLKNLERESQREISEDKSNDVRSRGFDGQR